MLHRDSTVHVYILITKRPKFSIRENNYYKMDSCTNSIFHDDLDDNKNQSTYKITVIYFTYYNQRNM